MRLLVIALLLAGCASDSTPIDIQPGKWASYHDMVAGAWTLGLAGQNAPDAVKQAFAQCAADRAVKFTTPDELMELDAYARGERSLSIGELRRLDSTARQREGIGDHYTSANVGLMADTCPADVPQFQQFLKL